MSLFKGPSSSAITPDYTGLQIQTAVSALPIPIVWGMTKIAPNVIWYTNFDAVAQGGSSGGGKGLFNSGNSASQYTYTADVIMALCEGPIAGINQIWRGQSIYTLASLGLSLYSGATPQPIWPYLATTGATETLLGLILGGDTGFTAEQLTGQIALAYQGTAYVAAANYDLTSSATLDNHNFEVEGFRFATGYGPGYASDDADPALIVFDFLCDAQFGIGFAIASIDATTLVSSGAPGGDSSFQTYCRATGLALSPGLTDQETASSILERWLQLTNTAAVWSGGLLRFIPYGDTPVSNLGFNFTPNVTPIYDLDDDDFIVEDNADPVQCSRIDLFEAYNVWRLECADRSNAYNLTTVESRDQATIELVSQRLGGGRGERIAPTVTAHEICDTNVALISGQLMLQRAIGVRNTYKFRLSWEYCLLDPMDLVTITDAILGLNQAPVRITDIEEDDNGYLEVTAEEFPLGYATAALYKTTSVVNDPTNRNASAGAVNAPLITELTDEFSGGNFITFGVSSPNPLYGGCTVYMATDPGGPFDPIGTLNGNTKMGVTTADFPAVALNPSGQTVDQVNTLSVNLTESNGALTSATTNAALALTDPCYVGGELVSFATATLTAANQYNLNYLVRGAFGTESAIADHPAGTVFARLDSAIFQWEFDQSQIGTTLYFKFASFNSYGAGAQSLADCAAYAYQIQGTALASPLPTVENLYSNFEAGFQKIYWDQVDDFRNGIFYEWRQGTDWDTAAFIRDYAHPPFIAQGNGTFLVKAWCQPVAGLVVYSEEAAEIEIAGNQLSLNLLASWDERATGWSGTFQNGLGTDNNGNLRLGGAGNILADNPLLVSAPTCAASAAGIDTLNFAGLPSTVAVGDAVGDTTTAGAVPSLATVTAITPNPADLDFGSVAVAALTNVITDPNILADGQVLGPVDYGAVTVGATTDIDYGSVTGSTVTVTISAPLTGAGVSSGDNIVFSTPDVLEFGGVITDTPVYYTIPASHIVNAGSVVQASVNASTQIVGVPVGQNILSEGSVLTDPDILGSASTQYVDGWVEIALSQDGVTWGAWQKFVPGVYPAQAWNFRLALQSDNAAVYPEALAFSFAVQLPARIDHYQNQAVGPGGETITFARDSAPSTPAPFNGGPGTNGTPYLSVSWSGQTGDTYQITGLSLSHLTIQFFNSGGTPVARTANIDVEGY
jgi:hypothetical protein